MNNTEDEGNGVGSSEAVSSETHTTFSRRDWLTTLSTSALGAATGTATVSQSARAADPGNMQWSFNTGADVSSLTVVDGTVYVGNEGGSLYGVDATTGEQQWAFDTYGRASPTVVDGTVYVGSAGYDTDNLYALDATTGEQQWTFDVGDGGVYSPPAVLDDTVYVGSASYDTDDLYAVDATVGEQQWTFDTSGAVYTSPAVVDSTVYVGSDDGNLYAVDATTGEQQWVFNADGSVTWPTVANGIVYFGSNDGNLYAVDATTSEQQWSFATEGTVYSLPAVVDDTVYVGSGDHSLYAVDATTGNQRWAFDTDEWVDSSPTVVDGTVYVGSGDENLYAVDATTGEQQWTFDTGGGVSSSPAVLDDTVYVGSSDGNLYAVRATRAEAGGSLLSVTQNVETWFGENQSLVAVGGTLGAVGLIIAGYMHSSSGYGGPERIRWQFDETNLQKVVDSTVFGTTDGNLCAVDATTGTQQWVFNIPNSVKSLTVENGAVYASTSKSLHAVDVATGEQQWRFNTGSRVKSLTLEDGNFYVGSDSLCAVDATTGEHQWRFNTDRGVNSLTLEDGTVYAGTSRSLHAVDVATGEQQWRFNTDGRMRSLTPEDKSLTLEDGTVYASTSKSLHAVDVATGEQQWQFDIDNRIRSLTVVNDTICFESTDENLFAVDAETGNEQWSLDNYSSWTVMHGTVCVTDSRVSGSGLYAVDAATGKQQWRFNIDGRMESLALEGSTSYVDTSRGVYAVDVLTGEQRWRFNPDRGVDSVVVGDGAVYVSRRSLLYAVDDITGIQQWQFDTDKTIKSLTTMDGTVYVKWRDRGNILEAGGGLHAVDAATGEQQWQFTIDNRIRSLTVVNDTVYVESDDDSLYALNTADGSRTHSSDTHRGSDKSVGENNSSSLESLLSSARDSTNEATSAYEAGDHDRSVKALQRALSEYNGALNLAEFNDDAEMASEIRSVIHQVETYLKNARVRQIAADLESAETTLTDGEHDRAYSAFENLLTRIDNLDTDRTDELGPLRKQAQRGEVRAQLGQARIRLDAGREAFDNDEYYDSRETFQEVQNELEDVLKLATDYGLDDLQKEANELIKVASTNADEARKALYGIGDVGPVLNDVPDVRSEQTGDVKPSERRIERARSEGIDAGDPVDDPINTSQETGQSLDQLPLKFEQTQMIADGRNATVWKVRRTEATELAALKRPHFRGSLTRQDAVQFLSAAETWDTVDDHPNVVTVRDWGFDGQPWLLMNYCSGGDVSEVVGSIEIERTLDILIGVADGLTHAEGVYHLDIKPANILLDDDGTAKLADWGLARLAFQRDQTDTSMGMSPPYAAPEQIDRTLGPRDSRTDVYQLGVTAFELLTGDLPFDPEAPESLERRILNGEPPLPSDVDPSIPSEVDTVVSKAMARDRSERYERAIEFRNDLRKIRDRETY